MREARVFLYESFAAERFGGNVAGVVLLEEPQGDEWLQGVASTLGAPTTGFVTPASGRDGKPSVRFFTPQQEIASCGHVTVAIATALVEEGIWPPDGARTLAVAGSDLQLEVAVDRHGLVSVTMIQELQLLERVAGLEHEATLAELLGAARRREDVPLMVAGTGLRHLFVPVVDGEDLRQLRLDQEQIVAFANGFGADTVAVYAVAEVAERRVSARMRDLCAPIGALEEPASGTTCASLAFALADQRLLNPERTRVEVSMGEEMGRPSRLLVDLDFDHGRRATRARVSGNARRVLAGRVELDL
jgi:trans-2,3-dihydro-3-hydroxyanthranilate isomerase